MARNCERSPFAGRSRSGSSREASASTGPTQPTPDARFSRVMQRVRFAPSPTGSLHVGNALSAVANRRLSDWMLLRIDDTDAARNVEGEEEQILRDLEWLGIGWDEGRFGRARDTSALPRGGRSARRPLQPNYAAPGGRHRHVPARDRGRRRRFRHHPRHPGQRPSAERGAAPSPARGPRHAAPSAPCTTASSSARTGRSSQTRAGRDGCVAARGRYPRRGGPRVPRGARPALRRPLRPRADPPPLDGGDRCDDRRGPRRSGRCAGRAGTRLPRRARPGRGTGIRGVCDGAPARSGSGRPRLSSASASCANAPTRA